MSERQQHDTDVCQDILMGLNVADKHLSYIGRIGKLKPGGKRLLRVVCNSEEQKFEVLRKAKNLRHSQLYNSVYIQRDLTIYEREFQRKLKEEVKFRKNNGQDAVIYRNQVILRSEIRNFQ